MEVIVVSADGAQAKDLEGRQRTIEQRMTDHRRRPDWNVQSNLDWLYRLKRNPRLAPGLPK